MNAPSRFLLALLLLPGSAAAQVEPSHAPRPWTVRDGLPTNHVGSFVQTAEGYLWMGTPDGVVRFDGVRMRVFDAGNTPGLVNNSLPYVGMDPEGDVWAWGSAPWVSTFEDSARTYGPEAGMPRIGIRDPLLEGGGRVWFPTGLGLMRLDGGRVVSGHPGLDGKSVARPHRLRDGRLLVPVPAEGLFVLDGERLTRVSGLPPAGGLLRIQEDADGAVWVPLQRGIARWLPGRGEPERVRGLPGETPLRLELDERSGNLWVALPSGLYRGDLRTDPPAFTREAEQPAVDLLFAADGSVWTAADSTVRRDGREVYRANAPVLGLFEDRERNVWVGTAGSGVVRLRRTTLGSLHPELKIDHVLPDGRGGLLAGAAGGGILRLGPGSEPAMPAPAFWTLHRDGGGTLWGGNANGIFRHGPGGWESLHYDGHVHTIESSADGWLWATGQARIDRLRAGRWETFTVADGISNGPMYFCDEGPDGSVWIGSPEGLFRFRNGAWSVLTEADGLSSNRVFTAVVDRRGIVWAGTEGRGINRIEIPDPDDLSTARITPIQEQHGLHENGILAVITDAFGRLWMSSNRGIFWAPLDQLDALAGGQRDRIHCTVYTEKDGLASSVGNGDGHPSALEQGGTLYLTTQRGLAAIHLSRVVADLPALPVVLEALVVGDRSRPVRAGTAELAAGERGFEIAYTAPTFIDPENVRFRYRLTGFNDRWVEADSRRTAYFTNVPPGSYTFEVMASQGSGGWGRESAALAVFVPAYFHETLWFRSLLGVVLAGLAVAGLAGRARLAARRRRELEGTVRERTAELETARRAAEAAREAESRERKLTEFERTRAEEARQAAEEAREIAQTQAKRLLELDQAKSRFFANVSHEFRTPLTLTIGPLEDVVSGLHGDVSPDARGELETAIRSAHSVLDLVNQILDLAKLEAGELSLEAREEDLGACVRAAAQAFVPLAERRNVTLAFEIPDRPVPVWCDASHLKRVLANLLSNAFKFTPAGGTVTVGVRRVAASDGDEAVIAVRDTGVGIGETELERVFDRFYQAHSGQHDLQPGTGIGLSLARELVDLHGGRIEVESAEGKGATFRVVLRLGREHLKPEWLREGAPPAGPDPVRGSPGHDGEAAAAPANGDPDDPDRTTVLVVEDHPEVRALVRKHLGPRYRILEAADGAEGLEIARRHVPDLVLSDVMMPRLDGFGLCRALKEDPELDFIPVVLLTARDAVEDRVEALGLGVDDYLAKPFQARELNARVDNLIAARRKLRERFAGRFGMDPPEGFRSADEVYLDRVARIVRDRLEDEAFTVDELAEALGQGRSQMFKRVKEASGKTPTDLIRTMRLERARRMLEARAGSVSEVAYAVGFKSVSHFGRCFREAFGTAPGSWGSGEGIGGSPG